MTTADRIKNRRIELGLTQLDLAKRLGLTTKAAVCKIEKQGNNVTLKNVEKYAKVLDCSVPYLMGWLDKPEIEKVEEVKSKELEEHFLHEYARLDEYQKRFVNSMIETFLSEQ